MTITTDLATRKTTITWTVSELDRLDWAMRHGLIPASATTLEKAIEYEVSVGPKQLNTAYKVEIDRLRGEAYDTATPAERAQSDAAIHFDPNA